MEHGRIGSETSRDTSPAVGPHGHSRGRPVLPGADEMFATAMQVPETEAPARPGGTRFSTSGAPADPSGGRLLSRAIERAKEGDRDAIRFLYVSFADNVYGYVRSIVRDEHDAEDVTHQVFAKLITAISRYEDREV